jgi:hypothetical protein
MPFDLVNVLIPSGVALFVNRRSYNLATIQNKVNVFADI